MYGLPSDFDPLVFVDKELSSITFASNVIGLRLGEIVISVESSIRYRPSGEIERTDRPPPNETHLVSFVGQKVVSASATSLELTLQFEGGGEIILSDEFEHYESFSIDFGDREIFV